LRAKSARFCRPGSVGGTGLSSYRHAAPARLLRTLRGRTSGPVLGARDSLHLCYRSRSEERGMPESKKRSFWDRLFSTDKPSQREERVLEYIMHRVGEGAHLGDIVNEEYVRRNASREEVEEICARPELVQAAREHLKEDFGSGDLDPTKRPR
jgi:hypothetical protein